MGSVPGQSRLLRLLGFSNWLRCVGYHQQTLRTPLQRHDRFLTQASGDPDFTLITLAPLLQFSLDPTAPSVHRLIPAGLFARPIPLFPPRYGVCPSVAPRAPTTPL